MAIVNNPRKGSGFTNLQRIMQANVGNRLGQAVGGGIQRAGQQAHSQLGEAENQFKTQAEQNRLDTPEARERVQNVLGNAENATEGDINAFANYRAGQYKGPTDIQNIETIKGQATEAQNLGKAIGTAGGRTGLLQRFAAGPGQYGTGAQRLDELLLGSTGAKNLQAARRSVTGLGQEVSNKQQAAQEIGKQYINQARGFGEDVTKRTTEAATAALTPAEQKAKEDNERDAALRAQAEQEALRAQESGTLSRQALEALGLQAGQQLYGTNLGEFIGYQGRGVNEAARPEEVMTPEEFQKFSNLRKLMGGTLEGYDPTKVNTYQAGQLNYNKEALQKALSENEGKLGVERQAAKDAAEVNQLVQQRLPLEAELQRLKEQNPAPGQIVDMSQLDEIAKINPGLANYYRSINDLQNQIAGIQNQINVKFPGAVTGGTTRADWAQTNLQTALQNLRNKEAQVGTQTVKQAEEVQ